MRIAYKVVGSESFGKTIVVEYSLVGSPHPPIRHIIPVPIEGGNVLTGAPLARAILAAAPTAYFAEVIQRQGVPVNMSELVGAEGDSATLPEEPSTPAQVQATFTRAIQQRLDDFARSRGYDSIVTLCTYATSTNPQFRADGQRGVALRDATWEAGYTILAQVQAGTRPVPATLTDVDADLPGLSWA